MEYETYDDRLREKYLNKALKEVEEKKKLIERDTKVLKENLDKDRIAMLKRIIILESEKENMKH